MFCQNYSQIYIRKKKHREVDEGEMKSFPVDIVNEMTR